MKFAPPPVNAWVIEMTLKSTDPRMKLVQAGLAEEPKEVIYLWREIPGTAKDKARFVGYRLEELGVTGVIQFLEKDNSWGRGQYRSLGEAVKHQEEKKEKALEKSEADHRDNAIRRGMEHRRQALGIPFLPVGINLPPDEQTRTSARKEE